MDQQTLDNIFKGDIQFNVMADVLNGRRLAEHKATVEKSLEAVHFIIDQEGYLDPDISLWLEMKAYFESMAMHIDLGLADPGYRPELEDTESL
jgi:hypothetical protein